MDFKDVDFKSVFANARKKTGRLAAELRSRAESGELLEDVKTVIDSARGRLDELDESAMAALQQMTESVRTKENRALLRARLESMVESARAAPNELEGDTARRMAELYKDMTGREVEPAEVQQAAKRVGLARLIAALTALMTREDGATEDSESKPAKGFHEDVDEVLDGISDETPPPEEPPSDWPESSSKSPSPSP